MRKGSNLLRLGDFNQTVVLDAVRRSSTGVSRVELGKLTGLTAQTVSNIARRLINEGLVREAERVQIARGKPRTLLRIEPDGCYAVGVHIDPAMLTFVIVDLAGQVKHYARRPTPVVHDPARVIELISSSVHELIDHAGIDRALILGLGVAAPGPVDVSAGVLLDPPQLAGWRNVRLRSELHDVTGMPVLLDKDVTAAAAAEMWASDSNHPNFVFLYLGSGVGLGVVMNDEVLRGATNNIGEVGGIIVDVDAEDVGFGVRGSLATSCIPQAIVIQAMAVGLLARPVDTDDFVAIDRAFTEVCQLAYGGNKQAEELIDRSARRVAAGLTVIVNLLDVDRIVLGGPIWSRISSRYLSALPDLVRARLAAAKDLVLIEGSGVGEHVAAQGAAALVLDHFLTPRPSALLME